MRTRERGGERETDRQTNRQRDRQTDRQTDRRRLENERGRGMEREKETDRQTETNRQTERERQIGGSGQSECKGVSPSRYNLHEAGKKKLTIHSSLNQSLQAWTKPTPKKKCKGMLLFAGCFTSQQHVSVCQGRVY